MNNVGEDKLQKELLDSTHWTIFILQILGVWPRNGKINKHYSMFCIFQIMTGLCITIVDTAKNTGSLVGFTKCFCFLSVSILATSKLVHFLLWRKKISEFYNIVVQKFWYSFEYDRESFSIMVKWAHQGKIIVISYTCMVFVSGALYLTLPIVEMYIGKGSKSNNTEYQLPFGLYFPFEIDIHKRPLYDIMYIIEVVSSVLCLFCVCAFDNIFIVFITHATGQFKVLMYKIEQIVEEIDVKAYKGSPRHRRLSFDIDNHDKFKESFYETRIYAAISKCIQTHQDLIKFSEECEYVYTVTILFQFCTSSLFICLCGFQITTLKGDHIELLTFVSCLTSALLQLFMYCHTCNEIMSASEDVATAAYKCEWYNCSDRLKSLIRLMILRGQKTVKFTAGKFYIASLESFCKILSTSGSYFTLLTTIHEGED